MHPLPSSCQFFTNCWADQTQNAVDAAKSAIEMLQQRVDGLGGVILIDKQGQYGYAHNTSKMAFAFAESPDVVIAKIKI